MTDEQAALACLETLKDPESKRVLPPTADMCGAPITQDEVLPTLENLPTGKSSGPDRLPNKLYKVHSKTLAAILTHVFNESHREGALPATCIEGTISVLYKKNKRNDPRNYRPITLLNNDYKILTRVLTRRMNVAVLQFVSPQQNGFVPGGFLPENIMLLKLIQAYVEDEDSEAYFVFLDMEKAFDRSSWEYLQRALHAIGFDENFINYIKLFYSHDNPPTRRIAMNGHLGQPFPLNSGVAQGCPLSPLLFLLITEALTRLIVNDETITGIEINGVRHVISQYADDSTLMGRNEDDWKKEEAHTNTWCKATAMSENASKREGQLLAKLNRHRDRAPRNVIKDDAWVQDGDTIRALGVPMGNKIDELGWWTKKYREVKQRVAAWRSIAHMSVTGRNLLLQAILYGSIRFWLFSLVIHSKVVKWVEEDAYHLIWASNPELFSNEDGTEKKARAYIKRPASYLPQKKGGAGLMHLKSHIRAFYAQWGRRYLHPSAPPWKSVADTWLADKYPLGRGMILSNMSGNLYTNIPPTARYFRKCIKEFENLQLIQDMSFVDEFVAGESIFFNHRFEVPVSNEAAAQFGPDMLASSASTT